MFFLQYLYMYDLHSWYSVEPWNRIRYLQLGSPASYFGKQPGSGSSALILGWMFMVRSIWFVIPFF